MNPMKRMALAGGTGLLALALAVGAPAAEGGGEVDLSLQDALKSALQKNFDVQVQRTVLQEAHAALKGAYGIYDTQLQFTWYNEIDRQPATSILQAGVKTSLYMYRTDDYNLGLTQYTPWGESFQFTWDNMKNGTNSAYFLINPNYTSYGLLGTTLPLLQGFGKQVANRPVLKAKLDTSIANAKYLQNLRDTLLEVESDYWYLVYAIKDLEVKEKALDLAKRFQDETRKKIEVGVLAPIEQVSADAQVALREQDIIVAEQSVGDREDILKLSLGIPKGDPEWGVTIRPTDEPVPSATSHTEEELIKSALDRRPELKQVELQLEKDKVDVHWAKNQTLPQLNLTASLTYSGAGGLFINPVTGQVEQDNAFSAAWSQITNLDYKTYYVGLTFKYPLQDRASKAQFQSLRLAQTADEISFKRLQLSVMNEVRSALRNLEAAQKRVAAAKVTLELQKEKLDAEQKKYDNGLSTAFNVLSYQNDLLSSASALLNAVVTAQVAGSQLDRAVGTYLETHGVSLEDAQGHAL